jgi:radical SAM superfamily enzyme YgiQ (UPF0313 family)
MKVLLVSPNVESLPDPVFPLGLSYIAAALNNNQTECQVLDLCFVQDFETAIKSALDAFQPDIVGLSLRNLDNVSYPNYVSYLPFYRQVVQAIRRQSRARIVVGGSGFSLMPDEVLAYLNADFGIAGEAELSFVQFMNQLDGKKDHREDRKPVIMDYYSQRTENLDDVPLPDRSRFDNETYLKWGGMGNIQTKRGCPFRCIYCSYPIIEGKKVRLRDPGRICDEIESMLENGTNSLFFVDNAFNYPIKHAQSVCQEIISRKLDMRWSCYANPGFVTEELIDLMLAAGCTGVEFGSDAANETMLSNLGKGFTVHDLQSASSICRRSGMSFCHSLLLGGPGETMKTVHQTLDMIIDMSPTAVICMIGIRVFPKTSLSLIATKEGMIDPGAHFPKPVFYLSPAIENEILPFIEKFSRKNPTWIFPGLNININVELQKKLRRFGVKGPLWEHMKVGERFRKR